MHSQSRKNARIFTDVFGHLLLELVRLYSTTGSFRQIAPIRAVAICVTVMCVYICGRCTSGYGVGGLHRVPGDTGFDGEAEVSLNRPVLRCLLIRVMILFSHKSKSIRRYIFLDLCALIFVCFF